MAKENKPVTSFFQLLDCIFKKNRPTPEEISKHTNQWMLNMMLSCDLTMAPIAHELSKFKMTNEDYFEFLWTAIPKCNKFIKYNASKMKKEQDAHRIMEYYGCNYQHAKTYVQLIEDSEMVQINDYFDKRGIKK